MRRTAPTRMCIPLPIVDPGQHNKVVRQYRKNALPNAVPTR
jgi:hypothetical protein